RNLSRYRAAVLHAAVTGRLTEEWRKEHGPPEEPASELLERILEERRKQWEEKTLAGYEANGKKPPKNWKGRYKEPSCPKYLHDKQPLPELPGSWYWATHDQVGNVQLGRQRSPQHHDGDHMRPYLRVANVYEEQIDTNDVLWMNFTPSEFKVYELKYGDILLNEGQSMELVGRPAMYRNELPGSCFQNTLVRQRVFNGVSPEYATLVCRAQFRAGRYRQIAKITTSIAHLGAQRFSALEFPLPPKNEQDEIVQITNEKLTQIETLEGEICKGMVRANHLRQAILKAAFEGKLVPQDPNDEPASVLLERIREQAAKAPKTKRKTRKKSSRKAATT
ncbi:MAG: restriction endonuclease subunit S, partial [Phycisphaerales bacterium JB047]